MRRRDFLFVVGSAAVAWPLAGRAQQVGGIRRIAILMPLIEKDRDEHRFVAFRTEMEKLGWIEGKNVHYDIRWASNSGGPIKGLANEIVRQTPDVIFVVGAPLTVALHTATKSLPIVFTMTPDPVGEGVVESLAHPGGNVTGFSAFFPKSSESGFRF